MLSDCQPISSTQSSPVCTRDRSRSSLEIQLSCWTQRLLIEYCVSLIDLYVWFIPQVLLYGIPQSAPMDDQELVEPLVTGIDRAFLERHSQDEDLLEWLLVSAGVVCMASVKRFVEPNRAMLYMFYCNYISIILRQSSTGKP